MDFEQKLGNPRWNNGNRKKPTMEIEDADAINQVNKYFEPLAFELSELLVKHVTHGNMKFIGDIAPFMRAT